MDPSQLIAWTTAIIASLALLGLNVFVCFCMYIAFWTDPPNGMTEEKKVEIRSFMLLFFSLVVIIDIALYALTH